LANTCLEEVEFPTFCNEGKGKQKEPSLLRIKLKWKGRYGRVEDLGLPAEPPGKMFRADFTGIPLTNEEREASKPGAQDVRRVRSRDQSGAEGLRGAAGVATGALNFVGNLV